MTPSSSPWRDQGFQHEVETLEGRTVPYATIHGSAFDDADFNGLRNATETGAAGWTVIVRAESGNQALTTSTDATGHFQFANVPPGNYRLQVVATSSLVNYSPKDAGPDDTVDSDVYASGYTDVFTLIDGQTLTDLAAGYYTNGMAGPADARIEDRLWFDVNTNGIQDIGEAGAAGVSVQLLDSMSMALATTTTDAQGEYAFTGLFPGDYRVRFTAPTGYQFTGKNQGGDILRDSDADATGLTDVISMSGWEFDYSVDAGLVPTTGGPGPNPTNTPDSHNTVIIDPPDPNNTGGISDLVWLDQDGDGVQDVGEPGLANKTVTLFNGSGTWLGNATTDAQGHYAFTGLAAGTYQIQVVLAPGYQFSPAHQGIDPALDSDVNATGYSDPIVLTTGQARTDIDAGLISTAPPTPTGSIGDFVWRDQNHNGIQDLGEPGMANKTVNLLDGSGNFLSTTTTDTQGHYSFTGLTAGTYKVQVLLPAFYYYSPAHQGGFPALDSDVDAVTGMTPAFTLTEGQTRTDLDAGLIFVDYADPGATLGDFVWNDLDFDGLQDVGEPGFANVTVNLRDASGLWLSTTTTDSTGHYTFTDQSLGNYLVEVIIPAGYQPTLTNQGTDDALDSDAAANGLTGVIGLNAEGQNLSADIGLRALPVVTIDPDTQTVNEGGAAEFLSVYRSGGDLTQPLVVNLALGVIGATDPLATWADDYLLTGPEFEYQGAGFATVTFAPGVGVVMLEFGTQTDSLAEGTERARVTVLDGGTDYVAGTAAGGTIADVYILDGVVQLNLLADTNVDGLLNAADDALEDDAIGKLVFVNDDDDDASLVRDWQDTGAVAGEDDLALVRLLIPAGSAGMTARLTLTGDTAAVRLWESPDRTGLISSIAAYAVGPAATTKAVYVEGLSVGFVTLRLELLDAAGNPLVQTGPPVADTLNVRVTKVELDVTDNLSTVDPEDGFWDYMPGYRGTSPVLSSGAFNAQSPLAPQRLHAILPGLGTSVGAGSIHAVLVDVTKYVGYAGNELDPGDGATSIMEDMSFSNTSHVSSTTSNIGWGINATLAWIDFFVRDYAANAYLGVVVQDTAGRFRSMHKQQVVRDADKDGLQDGWEVAAIAEFTAQYGIGFTVPKLKVFSGFSSNPTLELADPDGANNADGGRNLGTHKTQDDSLTVFQEYRGFVLDGGGFDGDGVGGHSSGHKRLSPAFKEFLWEVDTMQGIQHAPVGGIQLVVAAVAKDYSDKNRGPGIRVYWVNSELQTPNQVFGDPEDPNTVNERNAYANAHRDPWLKREFIQVMFVDDHTGAGFIRALTEKNSGVVTIFMEKVWTWINAPEHGYDHIKNLRYSIAHETTHTLLDEKNSHGFDGGEHLIDPDGDGDLTPNEPGDAPEVMYRLGNDTNNNSPPSWFDATLRWLDLNGKQGVDR